MTDPDVPPFTSYRDAGGAQMSETGNASREGSETVSRGIADCGFCPDLPHREASHCPHCHSSWTRTSNTAHCMTCHLTFGSPTAFDAHLQPIGCRHPSLVVARKTGVDKFGVPVENKWGTVVWRLANDGRHPFAKGTP